MSLPIILLVIGAGLLLLSLGLIFFMKRQAKKINKEYYSAEWKHLQSMCATRKTWPDAIVRADDLLNEALKQRGYKGRTTGERLVAAQHDLSSNDTVWAGHKLRNNITNIDVRKLKKQDIILGLKGFRQALRDLGALDA